jgi:hypothetical protein
MDMMSRPIFTKKIKHNDTVYNLELWNSIDDDYLPEPPAFRKEFFNDIDMSGAPTPADTSRYQDRFDSWFDKLPVGKRRQYARAIDESNRIIISMVWDLINVQDKADLFNNNLRQFSNWFSGLEPTDIDFYMTRVMSKQSLMPAELTSPVSGDMLTEQEVTDVLGKVYDSIDDDLIRATSINGLLCISCTDETRLQKAKKHMVRHGSILRDYRKKENANGRVIYTYIFSKP